MPDFSVIVVNGPPASGKTRLASRLALDLGWIYLSKDKIKESLFDSLGHEDRAFSRKLGKASFELLLQFAAELSAAGIPFIIDSSFRASDGPLLSESLGKVEFLQVYCSADSP